MPTLPDNPTLRDLQTYIKEIEKKRGFSDESLTEKCLLLGEEVGELFKAIRKLSGIKTDPNSASNNVSDELADVLSFIVAIANRLEIDLALAFSQKETLNNKRTWL